MQKPYSQACENNKLPIFSTLQPILNTLKSVVEIGSGTGQHAVHVARLHPQLQWQCCDQAEYLPGIQQWLDEAKLDNLPAPQPFEVNSSPWPSGDFQALYSANTLHIMSWASVERLFARIAEHGADLQWLFIYGPFNYLGQFTSASNAEFDQWLKSRDPMSGIRDAEAVSGLAAKAGFALHSDCEMPANNRLLIWKR
ncbi:DUF938 domain-containing protein [Spongiibacter marinus]|uniref:DUF938 domain-containing protein n=1 Tax=Spongiibacter marinus TaxID=354246 RepID=UPI00196206DB|nr:DUF938 domain-containing protein [Spongiibacter marinus]MBM7424521.1 hypothetical protein [Spongiibacter marinus]